MALLVGRFRRLELAEDALADAFEQASRHWPRDGVPDNPAGWLHTAARRRAVDVLRAEAVRARRVPELVGEQVDREERAGRATAERLAEVEEEVLVRDDVLRLVFLCCHPALALEARAALTLRLVLGLPTAEIARLFLVSEPTMAARLTRARKKLVGAGVALRLPPGERLDDRVEDVLRVVYLTFTAGYAPGAEPAPVEGGAAEEAVRLGRLLDALLPGRADVRALLALMLLQHSRREARVSASGELVLLPDQDRARWHHDEIAEGLGLLVDLPVPRGGTALELYLQAMVAAVHAGAPTAADTDWGLVAGLYAQLEELTGSAVVRLNRAVAVAEADGPAAGLTLLDGLEDQLPRSHRLPAVRAELLWRQGRTGAAAAEFERALQLCPNEVEQAHLHRRLTEVRAV
ncbi:RNA polymerase subunit sigma-24 [Desertihabitans brevis]|uniref:RNA polymerase subunit sigma-24 n=2 Tax=Desertihabitans brevis TaxID=2268447 RepID=A0A367YX01_9ACTN|nr:RNA polymerase subunit sigma-24 [Desertihabitans brevis]